MATYEGLGLKRVVNASGNNSRLGSSSISPEVLHAMCKAAKWYVDMDELLLRSGEYISQITGAEAGLVTSGAAGGLLLATAACITKTNKAMMLDLPNTGKGSEVIVQKGHRTGYDQAVITAGANLIEVGLPYKCYAEQIEYAINEKTVALLFTFGELVNRAGEVPLGKVVEIGKKHGIPVIVDGSLINYPMERLRSYVAMGVDLLTTSGGKHIFGPPGTGFVCGRKDLIEACRMQAGPDYGIGRPLKLGKEEIIGLITALEIYINKDHVAERQKWESIVRYLAENIVNIPFIKTTITLLDEVDRPVPRLRVWVDEIRLGITAYEIVKRLREREPSVRVQEFNLYEGVLIINPVCLIDGDEKLIIEAIQDIWESLGAS